jgi:hypothetical protein
MSASAKFLQIALVIFNLVLVIFGSLAVIGGYNITAGSSSEFGPGMLAAGGLTIGAGLLGCLGALGRSRSILSLFVLLLILLAIGQAVFGVITVRASEDEVRMIKYSSVAWDALPDAGRNAFQKEHVCCGYAFFVDRFASVLLEGN